jgi:hypothetical protein
MGIFIGGEMIYITDEIRMLVKTIIKHDNEWKDMVKGLIYFYIIINYSKFTVYFDLINYINYFNHFNFRNFNYFNYHLPLQSIINFIIQQFDYFIIIINSIRFINHLNLFRSIVFLFFSIILINFNFIIILSIYLFIY